MGWLVVKVVDHGLVGCWLREPWSSGKTLD